MQLSLPQMGGVDKAMAKELVSTLPVAQGISIGLRTCREERQADRAVRHLDVSGRREHGVQGRVSPMGAIAAGRRLKIGPTANWQARPSVGGSSLTPQPENFLQFVRRL